MKKQIFMFLASALILASVQVQAADYRCYASKYPTDMQHFFQDGYVNLSVDKELVKLEYFYVNTVAKKTYREYAATYELAGLKGGKGALKDLFEANLKIRDHVPGDAIYSIYLEPALVQNKDPKKKGLIGRYVFSGHGYSYDWNICYNR